MTYEITCPMYRDKRGEIQNSFSYVGVMLDICFDTILKECGIIDQDDELINMEIEGVVAVVGSKIYIETLYIDQIKLIVTEKK